MLTSTEAIKYTIICQVIFYGAYYVIASLAFAISSLGDFDGTIPFNFKSWISFEDCCSYTREQIVNTVSMLITYPVVGVIFGTFIPTWVWDFSITTTLIHIILSCLVMLDFPTAWTWWICLGVSLLLMTGCGEGVSALKKLRNKSRLVVPEVQIEPETYVCK